MSQRALHALLAAAVAAPATALGGESLGVLGVAPEPGPSAALVEATLQLRERIAEYTPGAIGTRQLRERMSGPPPGAALADLERATEAARVAYLRGDYEGSLSGLRAIAADVERLPDGDAEFALWTKVMLRLARTELDLGRADAARRAVERVVRADPDVKVDRSLHPAPLVDEVERARAALRAIPPGELVVTASAPDARVYVNGRAVGTAPVHVLLAPGRYEISGATAAARVPRLAAEVGEGSRELALDFATAERLRPSQGPGLALRPGERVPQIVAAGGHLGLDRVVAVALERDGGAAYLVGSLYDVRRGVLEREGRVRLASDMLPLGGDAALAEFLVTGQARSRLVEVPGAPVPALAPSPHAPPPALEAPRTLPPAGRASPARVSLGLRLGWAIGQGNVDDETGMAEWISSTVPLQADLLVRVAPRLSVGLYGAYGFGRAGGDVSPRCEQAGASCTLAVVRLGVQGTYELAGPGSTRWLAAGFGYERSSVHQEQGGNEPLDVANAGLEVVNVQAGLDWRMAPGLSLGPFGMLSAGFYGAVKDDSFHMWAQLGVRCRVDL